jgi:WD40 repeat protein
MARKKTVNKQVAVGNVTDVSGEVNIAAGDIYKGYTAEQVSILLTQISSTFQPKPFDGRCPYKGLEVFKEEDAEFFFGREDLVEDLIRRIQASRSVFITGPSGCGKSSLIRAGLIPALKSGVIQKLHSERWLYEILKPSREPMEELARVASSLAGTLNAGEDIRAKGLTDASILAKWCEIALKDDRERRAILFIDQFEEVFTQIDKEPERLAFLSLLTHAATSANGRVILLFAMRSDFLPNCASYPKLNALLSQQFIQIGAMRPYELVSAIAQPILRVGLQVDPDLIAQIVNDMQGAPGALPLMQFALKDLFDSQQAKGALIALTLYDYNARGGVHEALERHADASFTKLDPPEQQLARSIFSSLIEVGHGIEATRRTASFDELVPANEDADKVREVIQKLADARLITTDEENSNQYTITHEKLITAWPWLAKLIRDNWEVIALQNEIANDANEWDYHQRDSSYLYTGARLANAREKLGANKIVLSGLAQLFIENGVKAYADELETTKQKANQLRMRSIYLSIALVAALVAVGAAAFFGINSRQQTKLALARQLSAQAQSINATRNSKQLIATLLAIQSLKIHSSSEALDILLNDNLAAHSIARMTHGYIKAVALSPNGKYVVSGGWDNTVRVWEAPTGKEVAHMTHDDWVETIAFDLSNKYIVSGGDDHTVRVWEALTGKEVAHMLHGSNVYSVVFSPNSNYIVSGGGDGLVRVWEALTGKEVTHMTHDDRINEIAFSPNNQYVASASNDATVRVWEALTGKEVARMTHDGNVYSVVFSPNNNYIVSSSFDQTVRVWEALTGKEVARMTHDSSVSTAAFSPDGKYIVSGDGAGTVHVWEALTGKEVARMTHDDYIAQVSFSPDGKYIVSGSFDNTARVWEAMTGKEIARMTHDDGVTTVAFGPRGDYIVSGGYDDIVHVWEATIGMEVARMTQKDTTSIVLSPDGKYIVSGGRDNTVHVWEALTGKEVARMTHNGWVTQLVVSSDGKYIASATDDFTAYIWETATGEEVARMVYEDEVNAAAFSANSKDVVLASDDGTVRVWEATTGKEVVRMNHNDYVKSVAFSPNGKYIVSGSWDNTVRVWEAATGKEIARMTHDDWVNAVAFSPDGKYVASASEDTTIRVWEATTGKEITRMSYDSLMYLVSFSPDGKYVVSAGDDPTVRVWEAATGKEIARMTHDDLVNTFTFSSDGRYIVSGSNDKTARVWEVATGKEIARKIHDGIVSTVVFSPNGTYIVSGSWDDTARVWMWQPDRLIANACAYVPRNLTRAEWQQYIGEALPYQAVCPNLPIEPEAILTPSITP